MEDESNSWVRRTKYSHTVWHRPDNSKIRAIPIDLQSVRDVAGQKTGNSSLPSSVGISDWRKTKSLQDFNEQESKSKEITGPTLSYFLSRSFDSNTVGPVPSSGSKEHNGGSEPVQRDKTPQRATVVAHASPSDLNSERPVSSLNSKGQSLKPKQRSKSPLPAKLIAEANPSDFDFLRPTLLFNPNVHSSKHKRRDLSLSPLPSTTNNYHKSFTFDTKFSQKNLRNLSPPPAKYFGSRNISSTSNREEPRPKNMNRALSPLPSTPLSEEFKLARSNTKRFSTPVPSRKEEDAYVFAKVIPRESSNRGLFATPLSLKFNMFQNRSPLRATDKTKAQKENTWARYFDPSMVKVSAVDAVEECRIDLSELYLGLRFAIGANSRLYHGIYKSQSVAVKIITLPDDDEEDLGMRERLEKQFTGEVTFLSHLHHPNVIKLVGASRNPPVLCILTEYLSGGSLRAFLHKVEKKSLPLQKLIAIALDIARGMEYVHSKGVIHRDLKPENILLDQDLCVKIADFGIACDEAYCYALAEDPGTYRFMAPEMLSKERNYGRKVDVYSFGLILWEMLTGRIPYEDMIPYQAAFAVVDKNLRPPIPSDCPLPLRALIEQCWTLQPEKRPDFWHIVKVLEQFESEVASSGTLNLIPNLSNHEHHKRLHNWIQKLKQPSHNNVSSQTTPKLF